MAKSADAAIAVKQFALVVVFRRSCQRLDQGHGFRELK